jgi:hypothetical protein
MAAATPTASPPTNRGRVAVPSEDPCYTLRRVWLSKEEVEGYYYGVANEAFWPLCHVACTRPRFDAGDWEQYRRGGQYGGRVSASKVPSDCRCVLQSPRPMSRTSNAQSAPARHADVPSAQRHSDEVADAPNASTQTDFGVANRRARASALQVMVGGPPAQRRG